MFVLVGISIKMFSSKTRLNRQPFYLVTYPKNITHRYLRHELLLVSLGSYLPIFRMTPLQTPTLSLYNVVLKSSPVLHNGFSKCRVGLEAIFKLVLKILTISCASARADSKGRQQGRAVRKGLSGDRSWEVRLDIVFAKWLYEVVIWSGYIYVICQ